MIKYTGLIDKNGYKKYTNTEKDIVLRRHIKEELNEHFNQIRLSEEGKKLLKRRKETIERSFADSKQNHGYRYAMFRGLKRNQHYTWLICAAQNIKNIVLKRTKVKNNIKKELEILKSSLILNIQRLKTSILSYLKEERKTPYFSLLKNRGLSTV